MKYSLIQNLFACFVNLYIVSPAYFLTHVDFLSEELTHYSSLFLCMWLCIVFLNNFGRKRRVACVCDESISSIVFIVLLFRDHSLPKIWDKCWFFAVFNFTTIEFTHSFKIKGDYFSAKVYYMYIERAELNNKINSSS